MVKALAIGCVILLVIVMIMADHLAHMDDVVDSWVKRCCSYEKQLNDIYVKLRKLDEYSTDTRTKLEEKVKMLEDEVY